MSWHLLNVFQTSPDDGKNMSKVQQELSYLQFFRVQGQGFRLPVIKSAVSHDNEQHILQQQQQELLKKHLGPVHSVSFDGYRKKEKPQVIFRSLL